MSQFPSVSLAYEKAESDIMHLKPRNPRRDRLVNEALAVYSYFQIGMHALLTVPIHSNHFFQYEPYFLSSGAIQSFAGFTDYFTAMAQEGWFPLLCVGLRSQWEDVKLQDLQDSYGQEWVSPHETTWFCLSNARLSFMELISYTKCFTI